jgi:hypothetical protein
MWKAKKERLEHDVRLLREQNRELEEVLRSHARSCGFVMPKSVIAVKSEPEMPEYPSPETR